MCNRKATFYVPGTKIKLCTQHVTQLQKNGVKHILFIRDNSMKSEGYLCAAPVAFPKKENYENPNI
jgi:hypothetical protein